MELWLSLLRKFCVSSIASFYSCLLLYNKLENAFFSLKKLVPLVFNFAAKRILDLLVHVSQCWSKQCLYQNCHKLKELFHHGRRCKTSADGGCDLCRLIWYFLQLHARVCNEIICHVPRCRDI